MNHAPQGRQDSNLQPPVLETGALPIELRPSVRAEDCIRARPGTLAGMTDMNEDQRDDERDDESIDVQEGDDEGEREESLPDD